MSRSPVSPTAAQSWLLGLAAPLEALNAQRLDVLGGGPRGAPEGYALLRELDMTTREDAAAALEARLTAARDASTKWPAWYLVRAAAWASTAYAAHVFTAPEAWSFLVRIGAVARARYRSWDAYGRDFVLGRRDFFERPGRGEDDEAAVVARLLDDPSSPWRRAAWGTRVGRPPPLVPSPARRTVGRGRDHATIAEALRVAEHGDQIVIAAGTYCESLRPKKNVELLADEGARVVVTGAGDHALFVDGVGVLADGIEWRSTSPERTAIGVRDEGVLRLRRAVVRSATHGIAVYDRGTMAFVEDVVVRDVAGLGVTAHDRAWLRADRLEVVAPQRVGISSEKGSKVMLSRCVVRDSNEAGVLVEGGAAIVRGTTISSCRWSGLQVSGGTLDIRESEIHGTDTAIFVQSGRVEVQDVVITKSKKNGLEVAGKAHIEASGCRIQDVEGSAAFVASGELTLNHSRIDAPRFDGVTVLGGQASLHGVSIAGAGRAALWLEGGELTEIDATKVRATAADIGARVGPGAVLSLDRCVLHRARVGVAIEGGRLVTLGSCISRSRIHALQVEGGDVDGGTLRVERAGGSAIYALGGASVSLATSVLEGKNAIHATTKASLTLRRTRVRTRGSVDLVATAADVLLEGCDVAGGENALEAIDGRLRLVDCNVRGRHCAIATDGRSQVVVEGGALVGGSRGMVDLDGPTRARASGATLVHGRRGEGHVGPRARWTTDGCRVARRAPASRPLSGEDLAPFTLNLYGARFDLSTDAFARVLGRREATFRRKLEFNGHGLAAFLAAVAADEPSLQKALDFDPEADLFSVSATRREPLVALIARLRAVLADDARFTGALRRSTRS